MYMALTTQLVEALQDALDKTGHGDVKVPSRPNTNDVEIICGLVGTTVSELFGSLEETGPVGNVKDFTDRPWCEECRIGRCAGEHAGFSRYTPSTGGGAREAFLGTDDALQVPCASVTPMFVEGAQFSDADDAPYVALSVTEGAISLRPHEARQLAEYLVEVAQRVEEAK